MYVSAEPLAFGHRVPQAEGIEWMKAALKSRADEVAETDITRAVRFYDRLAKVTTIGFRTTCLDDYTHTDWETMRLHVGLPLSEGGQSSLDVRMEVFAEAARNLATQAFEEEDEAPDAIIQVSCTGYDSPTAVQRLAAEKGWKSTRMLHLGHMGCYAAIPAVALARDLVEARKSSDDEASWASILLVELCTLHHNPTTTEVEQIVQQCLFADGAVRVDVSSTSKTSSFELIGYAERLIPDTLDEMTWRVSDPAFAMTLSRRIPNHISEHIGSTVDEVLDGLTMQRNDVKWWAIHPGGPSVIESTAEALALPEEAIRHSKKVFFERGNMSSTTIPHIWAEMQHDPAVRPGDLICSIAFGPGLTVAMNVMRAT